MSCVLLKGINVISEQQFCISGVGVLILHPLLSYPITAVFLALSVGLVDLPINISRTLKKSLSPLFPNR
jgi:hypothetical protein